MAFRKFSLVSAGRPVVLTNTRVIKFFNYATDDLQAAVVAAGYFNDARMDLSVNTIINCVVDASGTPVLVRLRVTAVPTTGNVTVATAA